MLFSCSFIILPVIFGRIVGLVYRVLYSEAYSGRADIRDFTVFEYRYATGYFSLFGGNPSGP